MELIKDTSVEQDDVLVKDIDVLSVTAHPRDDLSIRIGQYLKRLARIVEGLDHDFDLAAKAFLDLDICLVAQAALGERLGRLQGLACK